MGVSGCGKSEIGTRLGIAMGLPFLEGDRYHCSANVEKMAAGIALTDADRAQWLSTLSQHLGEARQREGGLVLSCSALKRSYRDQLRRADPQLRIAHLCGPRSLIAHRMRNRPDHFMPLSLLDSQLRDLEPLQADEAGITLDLTLSPERLVDAIMRYQSLQR